MKRKHVIFITTLFFIALIISCSAYEEPVMPNPGFGIVSTGITRFGSDMFFPAATAHGEIPQLPFTSQPLINPDATGIYREFTVTTNFRSKAVVPNAIAPAFWRVTAVSGWGFPDPGNNIPDCNGRETFGPVQRAQYNKLTCMFGRGFGGLLPGLSSINVSEPGIEFQMGAEQLSNTYGMPTFQFYDMYGTLVAQTTATAIDTEYGLWAKGWTHCLAGLPAGTYSIDLINATWDGTGERKNTSAVYLYGADSANYIDDTQFFVAQQYRDLLNREPDSAGLSFWVNKISQCSDVNYREPNETYGQCVVRQRAFVTRGIWNSDEFSLAHPGLRNPPGTPPDFNNTEFVRLCHVLYLRRDPSQAEMDFWIGPLNETNDYDYVLKGFINSGEYRDRFEPPPPQICEPTLEEINSCQQLNGWWDYIHCQCNYGSVY
jgi:hypothetical protein